MRYVAVFAFSANLAAFCVEDFLSAAESLNLPIVSLNDQVPWMKPCGAQNQFFLFDSSASSSELVALASRCVLLRGIYILLQACSSLDALYERNTVLCDCTHEDASAGEPVTAASPSAQMITGSSEEGFAEGDFSYHVETIGKKYSGDTKKSVIERVLTSSPLPQEERNGNVNYTSPRHRFYVFVQHAVQNAAPGTNAFAPDGPVLAVVHAVLLTESGRSAHLSRYDLRWRPYVGTTSMPAEEALLMANAARVQPGHFVMDPFCGTGSLLVAAAHHGAHTIGSDADGRAMRAGTAKGKISPQLQLQRKLAMEHYSEEERAQAGVSAEEQALPSMLTNFKMYRLPPPDRVRLNFSAWARTLRGRVSFLDAILTDPPYGLREPRKKSTAAASLPQPQGDDGAQIAQSASTAYNTNEVVLDLVLFAAEYLVVGGFLVYWHPTTDQFTTEELPTHPSLTLLSCTPQRLSLKVVRRLVVMVKDAALPVTRPSREECAPKRSADDLRALMDVTELPDNPDYTQYRQRVSKRRECTRQFLAQQKVPTTPSTTDDDAQSPNHPIRGRRRVETQRYIVEKRVKKLKAREDKQRASHEENLRRRDTNQASTTAAPSNVHSEGQE